MPMAIDGDGYAYGYAYDCGYAYGGAECLWLYLWLGRFILA